MLKYLVFALPYKSPIFTHIKDKVNLPEMNENVIQGHKNCTGPTLSHEMPKSILFPSISCRSKLDSHTQLVESFAIQSKLLVNQSQSTK